MEIGTQESWLDKDHPNYERWKNSRKLAEERGDFVKSVIQRYINCEGLRILDLGSGEGGTAAILSKNNFAISLDISLIRLKRQTRFNSNIFKINGDALDPPFIEGSFDLIILQDVIEHLNTNKEIILSLYKLLNDKGFVYLSTPNKYSIFNFIADPHWGLPFVAILKRESIKKYFLKFFRKNDYTRIDIAQLLSLKQLTELFNGKFEWYLNTKYSVEQLFNGNNGIIWSSFHQVLLKIMKKLKLQRFILKIAGDGKGIINNYFNPTFYFVLKKI